MALATYTLLGDFGPLRGGAAASGAGRGMALWLDTSPEVPGGKHAEPVENTELFAAS